MNVLSQLVVLITGIQHVSGIDISTPEEVEAVNGTNVRLKCTFKSTDTVSLQTVVVSWKFRPINSGSEESVCRNHTFCTLNVGLILL